MYIHVRRSLLALFALYCFGPAPPPLAQAKLGLGFLAYSSGVWAVLQQLAACYDLPPPSAVRSYFLLFGGGGGSAGWAVWGGGRTRADGQGI